jgi:hypothetical protein
MAEKTITTDTYILFPSPRNLHREVFEHQAFVPYPYDLIDLASFYFKGKASLFAAHRLADNKAGQVVTCELPEDVAKFIKLFVPD